MKKLCIILILLFSIGIACAEDFSVGVSPVNIDIGDVDRNGRYVIKFGLITRSTTPFAVELESEDGGSDFFEKAAYSDFIYNYSEEKTAQWIKFIENPVEIKATENVNKRDTKETSVILEVPGDSESGYHIVKLKPIPVIPSEAAGEVGTRLVSLVAITIVFNVKGDAIRDGKILDVVQTASNNNIAFKTFFRNTGTTTISARALQEIHNETGKIADTTSTQYIIPPGGTSEFLTLYPLDKMEYGNNYTVYTVVDYITGKAYMNSVASIELIYYKPTEEAVTIPLWILIVIFIIILVIIYYKWVR